MLDRYDILYNGGSPFIVHSDHRSLQVFERETMDIVYSSSISRLFSYEDQQSPIGNTLLVETDKNNYTYIGSKIYSFTTESDILTYTSKMGNSDVPYPYAIDEDGKYYLMLEKVIMTNVPENFSEEPYRYFYASGKVCSEMLGVDKLIGADSERYNLSYQVRPRIHYDSPWMENLHILDRSGEIYPVSEDEYVGIMETIGSIRGITPMIISDE